MLPVKLPFVDRIHPQNNIFVLRMENKATGESKIYDSPGLHVIVFHTVVKSPQRRTTFKCFLT